MQQSLGLLLLRAFIYLLAVAGVAQLISLEGYTELTGSQYGEHSLTEKLHDLFALLSSLCFLWAARLNIRLRPMTAMLAALTFMMFIRESDSFLDHNVFDGAWQLLVSLTLIGVILYLWRQPQPIKPAVLQYAQQPSAGILLSGIIVTLVFSRLFGRSSFWEAVMGERYIRTVKNIAEEGIELLGYTLILLAAIELLLGCYAAARKPSNP